MSPFDVILFDVGGVLLTNGWDHGERAAAMRHFGMDRAAFEARHPAPNDAWERDVIPVKAYLDTTVFYEPRSFSQQDFIDFMLAQSELLPDGALGILEQLAASHQYLLGALNNEARVTNDYRFQKFGLRDLFSVALSSCYLGLRKPDLAIYKRAVDILGRSPERILFIDDRLENVTSAATAGMHAIQFHGAEALASELLDLGVL